MRRTFILLLVSLFLSVGSAEAFADNHDKDSPRHEQRDNRGKKHKDKKAPKDKKHVGTPPPPPASMPPRFSPMLSKITKGCHDVNVWQIDHDTYIVKYRKGNRHYTRRFYPYADRYGKASLINVNWQPLSLWTLIPPIQLNINL